MNLEKTQLPQEHPSGDWPQWSNLVLTELKRLNDTVIELRKDLTTLTIEVVQLKMKSSLWGATAGAVTVVLMLGIGIIKGDMNTKKDANPPIQYSSPVYPQYPNYPPPTIPQPTPVDPSRTIIK